MKSVSGKGEKYEVGYKVSIKTIVGNVILTMIKIAIGLIGNSTAMIADGVHSFSDVITTVAVIIGLKLSSKAADKGHPYGHEKIESLFSFILGIVLLLVGSFIGVSGIINIINKSYIMPSVLAIYAAVVSIITKEFMYQYTMKYARKINSTALKADAWHHRSDALSSVGALIGIIGARFGVLVLDSVAAIIICIIILEVSIKILKESIINLIDSSASDKVINEIEEKINGIQGVEKIDNIKTRLFADKIYVDIEISVNSRLTVEEGHVIAHIVHDLIEEDHTIKHCMVHVNPWYEKNK